MSSSVSCCNETSTPTTSVRSSSSLNIDPQEFHTVVSKLRSFFTERGFLEVHTQNRLSILAACEDPATVSTYDYAGNVWPLPQTGQMWLEYELLRNPTAEGFFCVSTSYRNEPNPVPGRHDLIFPMFEFEMKGDMNALHDLETDLVSYLGYGDKSSFTTGNYLDVAEQYDTYELEHEHEQQLYEDNGPVFFLENFPNYTSPFWNMRKWTNLNGANKIDVILSGQETIGSAERSCSAEEMRHDFYSVSNGLYAKLLFNKFGKERVVNELEEFLSFDFFPRGGGGIGVTRLIRSMKMEGLM